MKIDSKLTTPLSGDISTDLRAGRTSGTPGPEAPAGGSVDVQLSDLAARLQAIQGQLAAGETVDASKVAEIRQAIAEGRFQINPDVIADRLLQTVRELIEGHQSV